jgi:hypothetical protein
MKEKYHGNICYGDSGGPQFVKRSNKWALINLTSGVYSYLLGEETIYIINNKDNCNELS